MNDLVVGSPVVYKRPGTHLFGRVFKIVEPYAQVKIITIKSDKSFNLNKFYQIKLTDLTVVDIRKSKIRVKEIKAIRLKENTKPVVIKAQGVLPLDPAKGSTHWVEGWQYDADTDKWWPASEERL